VLDSVGHPSFRHHSPGHPQGAAQIGRFHDRPNSSEDVSKPLEWIAEASSARRLTLTIGSDNTNYRDL